jgi:hypothetical protein
MVVSTIPTFVGAVRQLEQPVGDYTITYKNGEPNLVNDPKPLPPVWQGFGISAGAVVGVALVRAALDHFITPDSHAQPSQTQPEASK